MNSTNLIYNLLVWAPGVIFAITLHEWAHGFAAARYGDPTPERMGRLTLNPLPHIDPMMTLLVPGLLLVTSLMTMGSPILFGGAKPVPINPNAFRDRHGQRLRGMAMRLALIVVAGAGPLSNFLQAAVAAIALHLLAVSTDAPSFFLVDMLLAMIKMNVILGVFNLLPLPPLDGGRILVALLPPPMDQALAAMERIGLALVLLLAFSGMLGSVLGPIISSVTRFFIRQALSS
ncbi:site-2 protease family protein [Candidatus Magnetaquicoccus inordinatus]|uniref:site-2 protease family protein n=1 Tax=Candidatus Magnetaquicoccus inordinatus TaxID=2496818 RepID=UPI00102B6EA8|nr:site-2 protease family protein [Candidatus Magnetaquicoccus inordinatus]